MANPGALRDLTRLALPLSVVQVGYQLNGMVDTAFAGRIDDVALGAVGIGSMVFFIFPAFGLGVCMGLDPLLSQAFGAGEQRRARHMLWQGIYTAVLLSVPLSALVAACAASLENLGIVPELGATTREYMYARLPSLLPLFVSLVLRSYLQAARRTRPIFWAMIWTNLFNAAANYVLIFGDEGLVRLGLPAVGLPAFGVRGLGWATAIATLAMLLSLAAAVRKGSPDPRHIPSRRIAWPVIAKVFAIGLPFGLHLVAEIGIFAAVQVLIGAMGVVATAAHQVAMTLAAGTFAVCLGIGSATSVQVGRAIGRGDSASTRRIGLLGVGMGAGFMTLAAIVMWTAPGLLSRLLTPDPDVVAVASRLVIIAAGFQIVDGIQVVASGALRGAGITRFTFGVQLISHWLVSLPVGAGLAFGLGLGPAGFWWGLTAGLATAALVLVAKFVHLSRRPIARIQV